MDVEPQTSSQQPDEPNNEGLTPKSAGKSSWFKRIPGVVKVALGVGVAAGGAGGAYAAFNNQVAAEPKPVEVSTPTLTTPSSAGELVAVGQINSEPATEIATVIPTVEPTKAVPTPTLTPVTVSSPDVSAPAAPIPSKPAIIASSSPASAAPNQSEAPPASASASTESNKFSDQAKYVQHLFAIANSHSSSIIPGSTPEDLYVARMDIAGPPKVQGDGSKVYMLKEGNGSEIVTKNNIAIMQAFTPYQGQDPSLDTIKKDYGEPQFMKQGASDPSLNLGPAGEFAFWKSPFGGGFAAMIDTRTNTVKEIIVTTNNDYMQFLGQWGKKFVAANGKA